MAKFTDLMGTSTTTTAGAEQAFTTAGGNAGDKYSSLVQGRLKKLILVLGHTAATSLIEGGYVKIKSTSFGGIDHYLPFKGGGLATAPAFGAKELIIEGACDLAVNKNDKIQLAIFHDVTPVTPLIKLYGEFEG